VITGTHKHHYFLIASKLREYFVMQGLNRKYSVTMATLLSQTMTLAFTITIPIDD